MSPVAIVIVITIVQAMMSARGATMIIIVGVMTRMLPVAVMVMISPVSAPSQIRASRELPGIKVRIRPVSIKPESGSISRVATLY